MKVQKLNWRQAYWALYLSRFDFTLKHVPDIKIGKADRLSRRLNWKVGVEKDNKNQILIKEWWIHSLVIKRSKVEIVEKKTKSKNKEIIRVVEEMKKVGIKVSREDKWQIERDLVLKEKNIYVSNIITSSS